MPTGVYPRNKALSNLFQKGQKPWNTGLKYKGDPRPELRGKKFGTPFPKGNVPWNKGTKGLIKPNKGNFQRGNLAPNWIDGRSVGENKKEYKRFQTNKRIARKRGAIGSHTQEEWEQLKKVYNFTCLMCSRKEPKIKLTEDHIIPLTRGGDNFIKNIQPLCRNCNSKKGNKLCNFGIPTSDFYSKHFSDIVNGTRPIKSGSM